VGRNFDEHLIDEMKKETQLKVNIFRLDDPELDDDILRVRDQLLETESPVIMPLSETVLAGFLVVKDVYEETGIFLCIETTRDAFAQAELSKRYFFFSFATASLIFFLATVFLMNRVVLSRLERLGANVLRIDEGNDPSSRVRVDGNDEIATLTRSINSLLDSIERSQEELTHRALHDSLTGLPNRTLFLEQLSSAMARAQRHEEWLIAIIFLDLNGFKSVNDRLGHKAGDSLLCEIGRRLVACTRSHDTVARLGGDEFVILLENIVNYEAVENLITRIKEIVALPFHLEGGVASVTTSVGVAYNNIAYRSPGEFLDDADKAMYEDKLHSRVR